MPDALDRLRVQLLQLGATKLSWALEHQVVEGHGRWVWSVQAANEMGAPIELPPTIATAVEQAVQSGDLATSEEGVWIMDVQTGRISRPQPRPGDGAGAPGIAERMP